MFADVIVIGAGLSGLQAALDLHRQGLSVLVLESRDRVGGKTWSVPLASGRGCVELGAAWINDTNQHRMFAYTQKFGLELVKQNVDGDAIMDDLDYVVHRAPYGQTPRFSVSDVEDLERIRDLVQDMSIKAIEGVDDALSKADEVTLEQFVKNQNASLRTVKMVNIWAEVMLGVEASEVSARCFIDYCAKGGSLMTMRSDKKNGGQYLRFQTGSQSVAKGISTLLPEGSIQLQTSAKSITDSANGVIVTSDDGVEYRSRKVVVSIPTPLYSGIEFSPPLAGDKLAAVSSTHLGYYTKVIVCYDRPWWREAGLCGLSLSFHGPIVVARDSSVDVLRQFSLTCFVNGEIGRQWSKLPQHERRADVLHHISRIYDNSKDALMPIEVFEQEWAKEQWSQGAVCPVTGPNVMNSLGHAMSTPVGNVHFVGTEFAREWKGYMEGAVCSGQDGALEVLQALGKEPSPIKAQL